MRKALWIAIYGLFFLAAANALLKHRFFAFNTDDVFEMNQSGFLSVYVRSARKYYEPDEADKEAIIRSIVRMEKRSTGSWIGWTGEKRSHYCSVDLISDREDGIFRVSLSSRESTGGQVRAEMRRVFDNTTYFYGDYAADELAEMLDEILKSNPASRSDMPTRCAPEHQGN